MPSHDDTPIPISPLGGFPRQHRRPRPARRAGCQRGSGRTVGSAVPDCSAAGVRGRQHRSELAAECPPLRRFRFGSARFGGIVGRVVGSRGSGRDRGRHRTPPGRAGCRRACGSHRTRWIARAGPVAGHSDPRGVLRHTVAGAELEQPAARLRRHPAGDRHRIRRDQCDRHRFGRRQVLVRYGQAASS